MIWKSFFLLSLLFLSVRVNSVVPHRENETDITNTSLINMKNHNRKQNTNTQTSNTDASNTATSTQTDQNNVSPTACSVFFKTPANEACNTEVATADKMKVTNHAFIECDGVSDIVTYGTYCVFCSIQIFQDFGYGGQTFGFYLRKPETHLADFLILDENGNTVDTWDQAINSYIIECGDTELGSS